MKKKVVKLTEKDIERLVGKIIREDYGRLTQADMEFIDELHEEGMSAEDIAPEMDYKDYITVDMIKQYLGEDLSEGNYSDPNWDPTSREEECYGDDCEDENRLAKPPKKVRGMDTNKGVRDIERYNDNKRIEKDREYSFNEGRYDFEWDDVLGDGSDDKYTNLERDLDKCIPPLLEKYKNDFGQDTYGVIDAIFQILEGMFQKV